VALTFDDGPSVHTEGVLDVLRDHGARATLLVLGQSARVQLRTIARMAGEGHEIGNHSWNHLNMMQLTEDQVREQIDQTNVLVAEIAGVVTGLFRPPYGAYDDYVVATVQMPVILWSLDPLDWRDRDAHLVAERMSSASLGAILLAHDIHASTVEAIPAVLAGNPCLSGLLLCDRRRADGPQATCLRTDLHTPSCTAVTGPGRPTRRPARDRWTV
jgi:peptidoglycan/xylan/chitin deacetylase (PgdA/CDA1 family)